MSWLLTQLAEEANAVKIHWVSRTVRKKKYYGISGRRVMDCTVSTAGELATEVRVPLPEKRLMENEQQYF